MDTLFNLPPPIAQLVIIIIIISSIFLCFTITYYINKYINECYEYRNRELYETLILDNLERRRQSRQNNDSESTFGGTVDSMDEYI
jgi:hypothetical protein